MCAGFAGTIDNQNDNSWNIVMPLCNKIYVKFNIDYEAQLNLIFL